MPRFLYDRNIWSYPCPGPWEWPSPRYPSSALNHRHRGPCWSLLCWPLCTAPRTRSPLQHFPHRAVHSNKTCVWFRSCSAAPLCPCMWPSCWKPKPYCCLCLVSKVVKFGRMPQFSPYLERKWTLAEISVFFRGSMFREEKLVFITLISYDLPAVINLPCWKFKIGRKNMFRKDKLHRLWMRCWMITQRTWSNLKDPRYWKPRDNATPPPQ